MTNSSAPRARGSVVIPAHDEAAVLPRLLSELSPAAASGELEVVVVPNGCTDDTAELARRCPGVTVVELERGSKSAALNAGDAAASAFPRLYLDADVRVSLDTVRALLDALRGPETDGPDGDAADDTAPLAGRPHARHDLAGAHPLVRANYRARERALADDAVHLWGAGAYAVSAAGRARFDAFPDIAGDDYWIDQLFAPHEKVLTPGEPVLVSVPRTPRALHAISTRIHRGNRHVDLDAHLSAGAGHEVTTGSTLRGLAASVRGPRTLADAVIYAGFALAGRAAARRSRAASPAWERDDSSRTAH